MCIFMSTVVRALSRGSGRLGYGKIRRKVNNSVNYGDGSGDVEGPPILLSLIHI